MSQAKRKLRVLMYMQNYYSAELHRGVAQFAKEQGWSLNTSMYRSGHLPNRKWDGIVGSFLHPDSFYESYVKPNRIPAVSLTDNEDLPTVLPNNLLIGRLAADHLVELGYRNIAFYYWQSKPHEHGRAEALRAQLNPRIHKFFQINYTEKPRLLRQRMLVRLRVLRRQLEKLPKPLAIMAPLDDLAVEVIEACLEMNLRVPQDVGVLGVNNDSLICDLAPVPISSIDNNEFRIGYEGARLLSRVMSCQALPKKPVLIDPKGVKIRKSTDLLDISEVPDRHVFMALRYISEHFNEPIKVDDIVRVASISKRSLQDRIVKHVGHTLHEQLTRKRIEHAKRLLRTSDYKTEYIALDSGFGSRERFSKVFKEETGMSPVAYRKAES